MRCKKKNINRFYIALYMFHTSFLTHRYVLCCLSVIFKNSCNCDRIIKQLIVKKKWNYGCMKKILIWLLCVYALSESLQLCDQILPLLPHPPFLPSVLDQSSE